MHEGEKRRRGGEEGRGDGEKKGEKNEREWRGKTDGRKQHSHIIMIIRYI